jgi:putative ABC transport system ATP-binding protein
MSGVAVAAEQVSKRYQTAAAQPLQALEGASLCAEPGEAVAIMGPSGSGKSTLLHLVGAMDSADSGTITVGDTIVTGLDRQQAVHYRRTIGFVFQRFHLLPALTLLDNVAAPLLPRRRRHPDTTDRARELLAAVGLDGREHDLPSRLSGGQQQRVAIARALINNPRLLLADEPTGNLDTVTGAEILDLLLQLRDERGMTVLIATHDQQIAARCDRITQILDGRTSQNRAEVPNDAAASERQART